FRRKIVGIHDRVSCSNSSRMMRVACGSHRQITNLCILESVTIITAKSGCGIEHLDRVNGEGFQGGKTDPCTKQVIRVRRNGQPTPLVDDVADLACRFSLEVRKLGTDTEKMSIGGGHLHSRQNEK